jgi:hypothetical protein
MERMTVVLVRLSVSMKGVPRMYLAPAPLAAAAADLRSGALPLDQYISEKCAWLESADAEVLALVVSTYGNPKQ